MDRVQQRKITRAREPRACTECRRRKLRCDRKSPCTSCSQRNEATCVYEAFEKLRSENERRLRAEERLDHLEQLVQHLSKSREHVVTDSKPCSSNSYADIHDTYNGATHWSAMLDDIDELRSVVTVAEFDEVNGPWDAQPDCGTDVLFGQTDVPSYQQILSFLPSRKDADRLVAAYFRGKCLGAPVVHTAQFRRQYRDFWEAPLASPALWVSILFSILDIASRSLSSTLASHHTYSTAAAQCLVVGKYHRPQRFAVEALLIYLQGKCLVAIDIPGDIAVLFGTLGRLATSMGYHRRGKGSTTPFEDEMRCRTWSLYMQLDLLISFQLGLPSNVQYQLWDTRAPRNLLDHDFDEDVQELPLSRPDEEPTEMLFYISKHRLMRVFEKILRYSLAVTREEDNFEAIDEELEATYAALPQVFRPLSMADSVVDPPSVIVTRLCVYFMYQKCRCVLHRRHILSDNRKSLQICYDAAAGLVHRLLDIHHEFEPGGQLESEKWFMASITWHDFLLGCTVLCLCVCRAQGQTNGDSRSVDLATSLALLQGSRSLCETRIASSQDTRKVHFLIEATLSKFPQAFGEAMEPPAPAQGSTIHVPNGIYAVERQEEPDFLPYSDGLVVPLDPSEWSFMSEFLQFQDDGWRMMHM